MSEKHDLFFDFDEVTGKATVESYTPEGKAFADEIMERLKIVKMVQPDEVGAFIVHEARRAMSEGLKVKAAVKQ